MSGSGPTVRVMTWNIHGGVGPDRVCDLQRVAAVVQRHSPDIVALQEVDSRRRTPQTGPAFEFLAGALGRHAADAKLVTAPDGDYGHVVISRWPIATIHRHDLSVGGREPRAAIEATVETPFGALHVVAAHLGLSFRERRHQAAFLARLAYAGPPRCVILGDFNDWVRHGSVQRALGRYLPARTHHKTFPAWLPLLAIDRVYCRPAAALLRSWTDPLARRASDHLPIVAELDMQPVEDTAPMPQPPQSGPGQTSREQRRRPPGLSRAGP